VTSVVSASAWPPLAISSSANQFNSYSVEVNFRRVVINKLAVKAISQC
jgi:hypothetical protein